MACSILIDTCKGIGLSINLSLIYFATFLIKTTFAKEQMILYIWPQNPSNMLEIFLGGLGGWAKKRGANFFFLAREKGGTNFLCVSAEWGANFFHLC